MANPALIKAAVVLLTDKRTWKAIGVVVAAILTPFILLVVILWLVASLSSTLILEYMAEISLRWESR